MLLFYSPILGVSVQNNEYIYFFYDADVSSDSATDKSSSILKPFNKLLLSSLPFSKLLEVELWLFVCTALLFIVQRQVRL